jgi:hypothetical protein
MSERETLAADIKHLMNEGRQLIEEQNYHFAKTLMDAGFCIVPNAMLSDHMIMVSSRVYDAFKKLSIEK